VHRGGGGPALGHPLSHHHRENEGRTGKGRVDKRACFSGWTDFEFSHRGKLGSREYQQHGERRMKSRDGNKPRDQQKQGGGSKDHWDSQDVVE